MMTTILNSQHSFLIKGVTALNAMIAQTLLVVCDGKEYTYPEGMEAEVYGLEHKVGCFNVERTDSGIRLTIQHETAMRNGKMAQHIDQYPLSEDADLKTLTIGMSLIDQCRRVERNREMFLKNIAEEVAQAEEYDVRDAGVIIKGNLLLTATAYASEDNPNVLVAVFRDEANMPHPAHCLTYAQLKLLHQHITKKILSRM